MKQVDRIKIMIQPAQAPDDLLILLLDNARSYILGYTRRNESQWLSFFDAIQLQVAVIDFNRMGVEGIASRTEGGISTEFLGVTDYPDSVVKRLNPYRLIKGCSSASRTARPCDRGVSSP